MSTAVAAPRWQDYADGSLVDHFAWWAREFCVQTIDQFHGQPLELEGWQLDIFSEALAVDGDGQPYWKLIVEVIPRKNGKTTAVGAYGTYHADQFPELEPEVLLAAASDKQAGRLYKAVSTFIRVAPELRGRFHLRDYIGQAARVDGLGAIHRMASNPQAADGYNPSLTIIDELHRWTTPSLSTFWEALNTAGGARRHSQVFVITTAGEGHTREDGILGPLVDGNEAAGELERPHEGLTISRNHEARTLVYNYSAPTKRRQDFAAIRQANPASWVTDEYLKAQQANPALSDAAFLQLHGCVWAQDEGVYVDPDTWRELGDGQGVPLGATVCLGADGSRTFDTTVVARAAPADDGRVDVEASVYSARQEAPHHVLHPGGRIDFEDVENGILGDFADYQVAEAAYDPRYLDRSADLLIARLPEAALVAVEPMSKHMRDALAAFERGVLEGIVRHTGDPVLLAHVEACKGAFDPDRGWTVRKRDHRRPIDAVVAMALAYWRATRRQNLEPFVLS